MKIHSLAIAVPIFLGVIFLAGCTQPSSDASSGESHSLFGEPKSDVGLGDLCSSSRDCTDYCHTYSQQCEAYCLENPENEICKQQFSWVSSGIRPEKVGDPDSIFPAPGFEKKCEGEGTVTFTSPPMRLEDTDMIIPLGQMTGGHVTPTDHGYYFSKNYDYNDAWNKDAYVDIMAPADGIITEISLVSYTKSDYRIVIHHTCTFYTIYIHVRELSPRISGITGEIENAVNPGIKVTAGEVIGRTGSTDFSVNNEDVTLNFIVPSHYSPENWKIHTDDMFKYFAEPLRTQLLDKNIRQIEPRSGKIDFDIDGKLAGNWFVENTNGYAGEVGIPFESYAGTHLSFVYDHLDPSLIVISIGNYYPDNSGQFAIKGNSPDPATISPENGLVKYELVGIEYFTDTGEQWDRNNFAKITKAAGYDDYVVGVALVQMLEGRKIKFESFPDKTASEVSGFTENALIYER